MITRRAARIDALNEAILTLQDEIEAVRGRAGEDGDQVVRYFQKIIDALEAQRDSAALTQYFVDQRKEQRLEFLKKTQSGSTLRIK